MIIQTQDYTVFLGAIATYLAPFLQRQQYSNIAILVDENTRQYCLPYLLEVVPPLKSAVVLNVASGEQHKNIDTCAVLWQRLLECQFDRRSLLLNLGGGVIGDMGGFVAATYKRGIRFVQIPTTLLAQVDASIGGKLGIDFGGIKNSVGVFQNPQAVFIDPQFLQTLPTRQLRNGFAEVVKHALIADVDYWKKLQTLDTSTSQPWQELIHTSLLIKKRVVEADPLEQGLRKILNFGHTIGHAIESYSLQYDSEPLLHGEAVALGMIAETRLSVQQGLLPESVGTQVCNYLQQQFPAYQIPNDAITMLTYYLQNDKKNSGQKIQSSLLQAIGKAVYDQTIGIDQIDFNRLTKASFV